MEIYKMLVKRFRVNKKSHNMTSTTIYAHRAVSVAVAIISTVLVIIRISQCFCPFLLPFLAHLPCI